MVFTPEELQNITNAAIDFKRSQRAGMTRLEVAKYELRQAEWQFRLAKRELLRCREARTACAKEERAARKAGQEVFRYPAHEGPDLFAPAARTDPSVLDKMINRTFAGFPAKGDFTPDKTD